MRSRTLTAAALLIIVIVAAAPALAEAQDGDLRHGGAALDAPSIRDDQARTARLVSHLLRLRAALTLRAAGHVGLADLVEAPVFGTHGLSDGPDPVGDGTDLPPSGQPDPGEHNDGGGPPGSGLFGGGIDPPTGIGYAAPPERLVRRAGEMD